MSLLVLGLVLFVGVHLIPATPPLRAALVARKGEKAYRMYFSITSAVGLGLIVWGYSVAAFQPVFQPPSWGHGAAMGVVPVALILFAASNMPTHIGAFIRHPMSIGLFLWGFVHLMANGDLASILLFGILAAYALIATVSAFVREDRSVERKPPRLMMDAVAVVAGLVVTALFANFHDVLFGVPVV